jgi:hypothetical protein
VKAERSLRVKRDGSTLCRDFRDSRSEAASPSPRALRRSASSRAEPGETTARRRPPTAMTIHQKRRVRKVARAFRSHSRASGDMLARVVSARWRRASTRAR